MPWPSGSLSPTPIRSYTFAFKGPALSVDTACSSSLVAAHVAAGNVFGGVTASGLAAGAGLLLSPDTTAMFHKAGMLAADGRCKTLDAAADGYVRGEAIGSLLLQAAVPGSAASPLALFRGSAVNQDGRSSSLTAPNGPSQQEVVRTALSAAGLAAAAVTHLQMHGTGTPLGDPIEVGAAAAVFVDGAQRSVALAASTAKAWIGHTEAAAGVMGLTHASVALSHHLTHSILHLKAVNSHMATILEMLSAKSAAPGWHLPRETSAAVGSGSGANLAGISSFAFQGTNAHALLQHAGVPAATAPAVALATWAKQRVWVAPPTHILLQSAAASGGTGRFARRKAAAVVELEAALGVPQLAFLWQHGVLGLAMFPATAFVEMAAGATRQLTNSNDLPSAALRSAVFATPLALPAAVGAGMRVRCLVQAAAGSFEISSANGASALYRTHFYASLSTAQMAGDSSSRSSRSAATLSAPSALAPVLLPGSTAAADAPVRLATAVVAEPQEGLGMSVHPAVSEAAMHIAAAHQRQRQHTGLRVAARIAAVHMPQPLAGGQVWASSLVVGSGSRQEQQLVGSAGTAMHMAGLETRRLVTQRPTVMTPRMPVSPHGHEDSLQSPLFMHTPHTPTTPLYLLSPSAAEAGGYALAGVAAAAPHTAEAAAVGGVVEALDLESLQSLVAEQVQAVMGSAVGGDDPLMAAGLDSLGATELQQSLADTLGIELPSTLVFDYPTVNAVAEFLAGKLGAAAAPSPSVAVPTVAHAGAADGPSWAVAIAGAAGQHELPAGFDASGRVPHARWDVDSPLITADGTPPAQVGGGQSPDPAAGAQCSTAHTH